VADEDFAQAPVGMPYVPLRVYGEAVGPPVGTAREDGAIGKRPGGIVLLAFLEPAGSHVYDGLLFDPLHAVDAAEGFRGDLPGGIAEEQGIAVQVGEEHGAGGVDGQIVDAAYGCARRGSVQHGHLTVLLHPQQAVVHADVQPALVVELQPVRSAAGILVDRFHSLGGDLPDTAVVIVRIFGEEHVAVGIHGYAFGIRKSYMDIDDLGPRRRQGGWKADLM